jgi:hypothetical protein
MYQKNGSSLPLGEQLRWRIESEVFCSFYGKYFSSYIIFFGFNFSLFSSTWPRCPFTRSVGQFGNLFIASEATGRAKVNVTFCLVDLRCMET